MNRSLILPLVLLAYIVIVAGGIEATNLAFNNLLPLPAGELKMDGSG